MNKRRVVVTGMGVVSPIGNDVDEFWGNCVSGVSGADFIKSFDASDLPVRVACEVKDFDFRKIFSRDRLFRGIPKQFQFALVSVKQAIESSGLGLNQIDSRTGVICGVGAMLPMEEDLFECFKKSADDSGRFDMSRFAKQGLIALHPLWLLKYLPNMLMFYISKTFHLKGHNFSLNAACATGTQALGEMYRMILAGLCDVGVTGGTDSRISPLGMAGYITLGALSRSKNDPEKISRPFDRTRNGFVVGEGAGFLVVEEAEHALRRGARIYGEIVGYGASLDAFSITDPEPNGTECTAAIKTALHQAGIFPSELDYINAHGTSTIKNDVVETRALKNALGDQSYRIPVSSLKSMTGHLSAAAGAVEAIATLLVVYDDTVFPTINYEERDPECDLDYVPNVARKEKITYALSNSLGFGGQNSAIVFKKWNVHA